VKFWSEKGKERKGHNTTTQLPTTPCPFIMICSRCGVDQPESAFSAESEPLCESCYDLELEEEAQGGIIGHDLDSFLGDDADNVDQAIVENDEDHEENDNDDHVTNQTEKEQKRQKTVPLAGAARIPPSRQHPQNESDSHVTVRPPDISLLEPLVTAIVGRGYSSGFGLDSREILTSRLRRVLFETPQDRAFCVIGWLINPLVTALLNNTQDNLSVQIVPYGYNQSKETDEKDRMVGGMEPQSLLHWICQWKLLQLQCGWKGHDDMVDLLIHAGADVNAQLENTKVTPLFFAVKYASVDTCRLLVEAGANVCHKDCRKQTCLRNILPQANPYTLQYLLSKGLDPHETFVTEHNFDRTKIRINALDILLTEFVTPEPDVSWATIGMASVDDYAMCCLILLRKGVQISPHYADVTYFLGHYLQGSVKALKRSFYTQKMAAFMLGQWLPPMVRDELAMIDANRNYNKGNRVSQDNCEKECANCSIKRGASNAIVVACGHTICLDCLSRTKAKCPTCHLPLGRDLLPPAVDITREARTLNKEQQRRSGLSQLTPEQLQFECQARNLVVAQNDIQQHCIDSLVADWQDFTLSSASSNADNDTNVDKDGNTGTRIVPELSLSNTVISEDNFLWVAPSSGSVMIPIVVKGIPIFALLSTTSPCTVLSPRFVRTFCFHTNQNLQTTLDNPLKYVRAEDDNQKLANKNASSDHLRRNNIEAAPRKPQVIAAAQICVTAVKDFSFSLGKSGITIRLQSAMQAYAPHTQNWPVGVILGLDFLQSAEWTQLGVEVDLEVCLGRTVGLLTGNAESNKFGMEFDLLEPRRADHVVRSIYSVVLPLSFFSLSQELDLFVLVPICYG